MYYGFIDALEKFDQRRVNKHCWKDFVETMPERYWNPDRLKQARETQKNEDYQRVIQGLFQEIISHLISLETSMNHRMIYVQNKSLFRQWKARGELKKDMSYHEFAMFYETMRKETDVYRALQWIRKRCCSTTFFVPHFKNILIELSLYMTGDLGEFLFV